MHLGMICIADKVYLAYHKLDIGERRHRSCSLRLTIMFITCYDIDDGVTCAEDLPFNTEEIPL